MAEDDLACLGEFDVATAPREERRVELFFEGSDLGADGWLSEAEFFRGASDVPMFGGEPEVEQVVVVQRASHRGVYAGGREGGLWLHKV